MRLGAASLLGAAMMSSCHIYNKFDMPTDTDLTRSYVEARDAEVDSAALGNLGWEKVFTDPPAPGLYQPRSCQQHQP